MHWVLGIPGVYLIVDAPTSQRASAALCSFHPNALHLVTNRRPDFTKSLKPQASNYLSETPGLKAKMRSSKLELFFRQRADNLRRAWASTHIDLGLDPDRRSWQPGEFSRLHFSESQFHQMYKEDGTP